MVSRKFCLWNPNLTHFINSKVFFSSFVSLVFCTSVLISGPEVINFFSYSTQLSTKFQLLIKTKILTNEEVSCFKSLRCCIYNANKVKIPTIVGILTFMSRINFVLS